MDFISLPVDIINYIMGNVPLINISLVLQTCKYIYNIHDWVTIFIKMLICYVITIM